MNKFSWKRGTHLIPTITGFWLSFQTYKSYRCKAMLEKETAKKKNKKNVPQSRKKSFPNTSPASYDIATGENSYANSIMQAPFSSGKCVEIDWVSSWWYCSQALWKLIGKCREESWHYMQLYWLPLRPRHSSHTVALCYYRVTGCLWVSDGFHQHPAKKTEEEGVMNWSLNIYNWNEKAPNLLSFYSLH